ncbi:glycoside hydrolase family 2 protein [Labilibaculum euxinus]
MMRFRLKIVFVFVLCVGFLSCAQTHKREYVKGRNSFNKGWEFVKDVNVPVDELMNRNDQNVSWEKVSLPHTANIEPLVINGDQWQGTCFYRKYFSVSKNLSGKHLGLYFEGAMQVAEVFLNGKLLYTNLGGYLPFYVDITKSVEFGVDNCLLVKLNNEDNPVVPPGKSLKVLDFNTYSGIYRNVWLDVKDPLHISNEMEVNHIAAGGVFVTYSNVSEESAKVHAQVDMKNDLATEKEVEIQLELIDETKAVVGSSSQKQALKANSTAKVNTDIEVKQPKLWSPGSPSLYTLRIKVLLKGEELEIRDAKIGIRTFSITAQEGFTINGNPLYLRGTNRHQEYPYVGYAISDNANYRDAWKIKMAGFNFVRLSHYPQSQAFLNACDELGILVMDAIPGWQFFGDEEFQKNAIQDIRKMVRVDRNHPSVIMWESSLNESAMSQDFMEKSHEAVHEEFPGTDVYTCGWKDFAYDVFNPARQHAKPPYYWNKYEKDKPFFIAEYGDWEYYAQNAGFNQKAFQDLSDEERNSRQLRGFGQKRLVQQALNYQEAHNSNLQGKAIGDANWLMFDYNRGYAPDLESSGIMDIFRLPKFAYYFYKSQTNIGESKLKQFAEPIVAIANYYNDPSFLNVKVYSNCEEVELLVNGKSAGKQKPDQDKNSTHLAHPPFSFQLTSFTPGELVAKGYVNGKVVSQAVQKTPGEAVALKLWIDESSKKLASGCNDLVFAYAAVVDKEGNILPLAENSIQFMIYGGAEIIGANPVDAEAGIATVLLKAGDVSGNIKVTAVSDGLQEGSIEVHVE